MSRFPITSIGLFLWISSAQAFSVPCRANPYKFFGIVATPTCNPFVSRLRMAESDEEQQKGMDEAFRQLNDLDSIDGVGDTKLEIEYTEKKDVMATVDEIDAENLVIPETPPEEEIKVYTEMYEDLGEDGEGEDLYENVLSELGGTEQTSVAPIIETIVEEPASTPSSAEGMDAFMNSALEQAVKEAQSKTPEELAAYSENIMDDEDIMDEIREVFEKANDKLLSGLDDIRKEQEELVKESAEKSAQNSKAMTIEQTARMERAHNSMVRMLDGVNKETIEVEKAVEELKQAQEDLEADPIMKLISGDIFKQGAVAGAILFSIRSSAETVALVGGGGAAHATAALIQGAIALACIAYLFFV